MLVKELIELLQEQDQDSLVIMSKDGEGNRFSPFSDLGDYLYTPDSTWSGSILNPEDQDEYHEDDWSDMLANSQAAVCLWPVN